MIQVFQNGIMDVNTYIISNDQDLIVIDPGQELDEVIQVIDHMSLLFLVPI